MTTDSLDFVLSRRSATLLGPPGPTRSELDRILRAATTVPDHGLLRPFRLVVVEGAGRDQFGRALAETAAEHRPSLTASKLEGVHAKALRSPTIVVLVASPKAGKIETWEQHATAACAGYAIVLAANALGIGAVWKSVPFTTGTALSALLGLGATEQMFGWIHLGTSTTPDAAVRPPTELSSITTVIDDAGTRPYQASDVLEP